MPPLLLYRYLNGIEVENLRFSSVGLACRSGNFNGCVNIRNLFRRFLTDLLKMAVFYVGFLQRLDLSQWAP